MFAHRPRFVLIAETEFSESSNLSTWRFSLHGLDNSFSIVAHDSEPELCSERLELLAIVRGLEALNQPSEVTLVNESTSIQKGIQRDIETWRTNQWRWENFGRFTSIRNADLWQRIDKALNFHTIMCRGCSAQADRMRFDAKKSIQDKRHRYSLNFPSERLDCPAMVVVPSHRSRRTIRFDREENALFHSAAG